jgi:pimeloyl-ACP methyl ester carboxylesterase
VRRAALAVTLVLLLSAAACSSSSNTSAPTAATATTTTIVPAPAGLPAFYAVPQPLPAHAGTLVKSEPVTVDGLHGTAYRVMYVSTSMKDKPVAVTGLVAVPKTPAPSGGYPVVSWGHGTNGMADKCAPSLSPKDDVPLANALLDQGWEVVASDYEGEGTPGLMPYIAGISAARNTIDIVRAVQGLPAAHASKNYLVWGHSEGGQTAMYALNIGPAYAPELTLHGVVAGAPPSQFKFIYEFLKTSAFKHYLLMAAGGLNAAYGDQAAPLDEVLTPYGKSFLPVLEQGCSDYIAKQLAPVDFSKATKTDPFTVPAWQKILRANDPEYFTTASPVPLLLIQGGNDEQIPVASTALLADHLCEIHQVFSRWVYPGQSHAGVIGPSAQDMIHWMQDRFAGRPNPNGATPKGEPNVDVRRCPAS